AATTGEMAILKTAAETIHDRVPAIRVVVSEAPMHNIAIGTAALPSTSSVRSIGIGNRRPTTATVSPTSPETRSGFVTMGQTSAPMPTDRRDRLACSTATARML